jgi:ABC-type amino acid transport substrate-binding protein
MVAVIEGSMAFITALDIKAIPIQYQDSHLAIQHVKDENIDGFLHSLSYAKYIVALPENDTLQVIEVPDNVFTAQIAAFSYDQDIIDSFNEYLASIKQDSTFYAIQDRWFSDTDSVYVLIIKNITDTKGEGGVLRVAIYSDSAPFVYIGSDGQYTGFAIDLLMGYAAKENKKVQFTDLDFKDLFPYIAAKNAELGLVSAITGLRKDTVLFTDHFYEDKQAILMLNPPIVIPDSTDSTTVSTSPQ